MFPNSKKRKGWVLHQDQGDGFGRVWWLGLPWSKEGRWSKLEDNNKDLDNIQARESLYIFGSLEDPVGKSNICATIAAL